MKSAERVLETIERFEEDLTNRVRVHGNLKAIMEVQEAIEVLPKRDRRAEVDPIMEQIRASLQDGIDRLAKESVPFE